MHVDREKKLRSVLREARERQRLSQKQLADRLYKPQSFISKIESGERNLNVVEFLELCDAMNVDAVEIISEVREAKDLIFPWKEKINYY